MLSIPHIIVIFIVALVVFGPEKIPELARNLGKVMAEFRRHTNDLRSTFEGHLRDLEREADARRIAPSSPPSSSSPASEPASSPGTVPSNPPNASAIATGAAAVSATTELDPNLPDPMRDPYLTDMIFPEKEASGDPEPSKSELNPEQVSDGDRRSS